MGRKMSIFKYIALTLTLLSISCSHQINYSDLDVKLIRNSCELIRSIEAREDFYDVFFKNHHTRLISLSPDSKFYYKNESCHIDDNELKINLVKLINLLQAYHFKKLYVEGNDYNFTTYDNKIVIVSNDKSKWYNVNYVEINSEWFYLKKQ